MKKWLEETHGAGFELLRHFLLRFFDNELVSQGADSKSMIVWAFAMVAPWFLMFAQALMAKYRHFVGRPGYFLVLKADELWLVMLMMSLVGLLAAIKWGSLFPGLQDYRALGALPLKSRQIFAAKLAALLLVATAVIIVLVALPSVLFPIVSWGPWPLAARIRAHATASVAACYFLFFAIVALQGVLLNVLPPRIFGRVSGTMQGFAVAATLIMTILSFCVGPPQMRDLLAWSGAGWFPPLWYVGLYESLRGTSDTTMQLFGRRGIAGLEIATVLALLSYGVSYRRHRTWMVEGLSKAPARDRNWSGALLDRLIESPRQQAVIVFLWKTLMRSSHHRMILMGYAGVAVAISLGGLMGIGKMWNSPQALTACFVWVHMITLLFLMLGLRHLFSIPAELRANWTFQLTEAEGRDEWLDAVDRFVLWMGAAIVLLLPFPFEAKVIGWRSLLAIALFVTIGLMLYEWMFQEWRKLPFTCSHLPGKTPLWILGLYGIGLVTAIPILNLILAAALFSGAGFTFLLVMTWVGWRRVHVARREAWGELRLLYDEAPEPAVHGLGLGK